MPALTKNQKIEQLNKQLEEVKKSEQYLKRILQTNIDKLKENIEPLDQNKVYVMQVNDYEELSNIKQYLQGVKSEMYWSMPKIIITTEEITSIESLKEKLKQVQK